MPPWASAAHLGLAAAIFGLLAQRVIAGSAGPTASAPAAVSAMQR